MMGRLERRAEAISGEFTSKNVANTLSAFATIGTKPGERMMGQLERRTEAISGEFTSQNVANTLWAFATIGTKPGERMMGQLERRTEAISGEFTSQDVANTLWAFATIGSKPGERMMGQLERRAEAISGEFTSQAVAITLWAISFFRIQFSVSPQFCCSLSCSFLSMVLDDLKSLCQLHQVFISCDMIEGLHAEESVSVQTLKEKLGPLCQAAFIGVPVHPSASQQHVSDTLRGMGLSVEDEFRCPKSGYSIDMLVHDMLVNSKSSTGAAAGWAVEFDGPSHFLTCRLPVGGTLMKRRHLELLGYTVVSLSFWEWDQLTGSDERKEYLRGKLKGDKTGGGTGGEQKNWGRGEGKEKDEAERTNMSKVGGASVAAPTETPKKSSGTRLPQIPRKIKK
jgi:hypothetical protein